MTEFLVVEKIKKEKKKERKEEIFSICYDVNFGRGHSVRKILRRYMFCTPVLLVSRKIFKRLEKMEIFFRTISFSRLYNFFSLFCYFFFFF